MKTYPKEIAMMVYRDCQLDCRFCYIKGLDINLKPLELSKFYKNIIRSYEIEEIYPRIFIGGLGEPLFGRNYKILEELVSEFPRNKFVLFSNLVDLEKSISLVKDCPNIEKIIGRIVSERGGDPNIEGENRPSVEEIIRRYKEAGILNKLEFEILLFSANQNKDFPVSLLDKYRIPYSYAGAVPLGRALEMGLYLSRSELIKQTRLKGTSEKFLGATSCIIVEEGLTLIGLNVSLCPGALINEIYAKYPDKYASKLINNKEELVELRELTSNLIAMKKGEGVSTTDMCIGRELLYLQLDSKLKKNKALSKN